MAPNGNRAAGFKAKNMDELKDEIVMIDPDTLFDPIFMQGYCGTIIRVCDDLASAWVRFPGGQRAEYGVENLWMLAPGELIAERLRAGDIRLDEAEQADLFQIHMLDMTGIPGYRMRALEWATENPKILDGSVLTVKYWIENFIDNDRGQSPFRSR